MQTLQRLEAVLIGATREGDKQVISIGSEASGNHMYWSDDKGNTRIVRSSAYALGPGALTIDIDTPTNARSNVASVRITFPLALNRSIYISIHRSNGSDYALTGSASLTDRFINYEATTENQATIEAGESVRLFIGAGAATTMNYMIVYTDEAN